VTPGSSGSDRADVVRRGRTLSRITLGYDTLEGLASLIAGAMAGSGAKNRASGAIFAVRRRRETIQMPNQESADERAF
jgi:hypothetical protein